MEAGDTPIHSQSQVCSCGNGVMREGEVEGKTWKSHFFFTSHEKTAERCQACYKQRKKNKKVPYIELLYIYFMYCIFCIHHQI